MVLVNRTRDVTMNYSYGKIKTPRHILSVKADAKRWNRGLSLISGDNFLITFRICSDIQGIHKKKNGAVSNITKNVFLTLHGHNVHRQQRQLSKFLMR